ncbi:N-acetylglucosamine-6-phosphate deacetylase [Dermatophilus congolensis]|uniref:N-acetylglucosamine-6-phosphate deacetylase n=2 Tax=Dermatophilus congolensis TaxID=1863 RepID=UPI00312CA421
MAGDLMSCVISAGAVVSGTDVLRPGWVEVETERVVAVGAGAPPRPADQNFPSAVIVPGFVDTHCHGGGGGAFTDATAAEDDPAVLSALACHRAHGTTRMMASLVSASPEALMTQVMALRPHVEAGRLLGIHLEGPWMSPCRLGAHDPTAVRHPSLEEIDALLEAANGTIAMVTLAPELPGGFDAVRRFAQAGVAVAVGHTDATYDVTCAAIESGARVGTHLFNAMRGVHHREPGPVIALTGDARVTVELIADGVHVHPAVYTDVVRSVGAHRVALVTDAMAAAGMPDGRYGLGTLDVDVVDKVAKVAGTETIAGSTATMDGLFRFAITHGGLREDDALVAAVQQTAVTPAQAHGVEVAALRVGDRADLVALDEQWNVIDVMHAGAWLSS